MRHRSDVSRLRTAASHVSLFTQKPFFFRRARTPAPARLVLCLCVCAKCILTKSRSRYVEESQNLADLRNKIIVAFEEVKNYIVVLNKLKYNELKVL